MKRQNNLSQKNSSSYFALKDDSIVEESDRPSDPDESGQYIPMTTLEETLPTSWNSVLAERNCEMDEVVSIYNIPLWDQGCMKHLFLAAFDSSLDANEIRALVTLFLSAVVNIVSVTMNVFFSSKPELLVAQIASQFVFIFEFACLTTMTLLLLVAIGHSAITKNISTNTALDVAEILQTISSFSVLRVVSFVTPAYISRSIVPKFVQAQTVFDVLTGVVYLFAWCVACVVACFAIMMKVTQVSFAATDPIEQWTWSQLFMMLGLVLNLAKVDCSYEAETKTLLSAVHHHYCGPGGPDSPDPSTEGLYSRLLQVLGFQRVNTYELFETIFNFHFGERDPKEFSTKERLQKAANFVAFIVTLDNSLLRRFLQMVESPIRFYAAGRTAFEIACKEHDITGMEASLWRSDPLGEEVLHIGSNFPEKFRLIYKCQVPSIV